MMSSQLANIRSLFGPTPHFKFLEIPREVRDMIYDIVFNGATLSLVFHSGRGYPGENEIYCTQKPAIELLLVSRQVHPEALTRFRFHLNADDDYCYTQDLEKEDLHFTSSMRWALSSLKIHSDLVDRLLPHCIDYPNLNTITIHVARLFCIVSFNTAKED